MDRRSVAPILAAAVACLVIAATGWYGLHAILDEDAFADRGASTLRSDEIREEAGARMGAAVVTMRPELARSETAVDEAATRVANDPAYDSAFRAGAARLHHTLFSNAQADASLRIDGSGAALRARLREIRGWENMPPIDDVSLLMVSTSGFEGALRALAPHAREGTLPITIVFGVAGLTLFVLGLARARRRVWCGGMTVAAAAGLLAAGATAARDVALHQFDTGFGEAVVRQVWDAYLGDFRTWALAAAAAGLVVAAAGGGPRLSVRALLATPPTRAERLMRGAGLLAVAAIAVTLPGLVLDVGLVTVAGALVYVAAGELLRALTPPSALARPS